MTVIDDINANSDAQYNVSYQSQDLQNNKYLLQQACNGNVSWETWVLILAMGMLETNNLTSNERDSTKDNSGNSANVSAWNLSLDLVQQVGYDKNPWDLNDTNNMKDVVNLIQSGINKWGVNSFLNFVRGGSTSFKDGYSYGVADYRNAIKTMANAIRSDHDLLYNGNRVNCYVQHV
jgi:hypothetical protein